MIVLHLYGQTLKVSSSVYQDEGIAVLRNIGKYLQNQARNGLTLKVKVLHLPKRRNLFTHVHYTILEDSEFKAPILAH